MIRRWFKSERRPLPYGWWRMLPKATRSRLVRDFGPAVEPSLAGSLQEGSDGCTFLPNVVLPACWLHDALIELGLSWRADKHFYRCILDIGRHDEKIWRLFWRLLAITGYLAVTIGTASRKTKEYLT